MPDEPRPLRRLDEGDYIRSRLFDSGTSAARRYAALVVGPDASWLQLLRYELVTGLLGGLPGALGLALRRVFYPSLFRRCGRGVVFGRDLVIRNADQVELGDDVVIDDGCVIDGRGAGPEGVVIGDRVILGRGVLVQAKIGPVHIGAGSDIGSGSIVHAQGGTYIGRDVVLGGGAKISGGVFQIARDIPAAGSTQAERAQTRWTRGPIRIGDRCLIGLGCAFLDGVEIGEGCVIGAMSLLTRSVPPHHVAAGVPARVLRHRDEAPSPSSSNAPAPV